MRFWNASANTAGRKAAPWQLNTAGLKEFNQRAADIAAEFVRMKVDVIS